MSIHPLRNSDGAFPPHMTAATWQQRLDAARTSDELVELTRDFVATFSAYELHALPEHCRPPHKLFADDIAIFAVELVRHECTNPDTAETVHRLARFFSHASTRLAQLTAHDRHGGDYERKQSA